MYHAMEKRSSKRFYSKSLGVFSISVLLLASTCILLMFRKIVTRLYTVFERLEMCREIKETLTLRRLSDSHPVSEKITFVRRQFLAGPASEFLRILLR